MKKQIVLLLLLTAFCFCGCQSPDRENENVGSSLSAVSGSAVTLAPENGRTEKAASYYIKGKKSFTAKELKKLKKWLKKNSRYLNVEALQPGQSLYAEALYDEKGKKKNTEINYYSAELIRHYTKDYSKGFLPFENVGGAGPEDGRKTVLPLMKVLSGVTGGKIAAEYDCVVVSDENYKKADKNYVQKTQNQSDQEGIVTYDRTAPPYEYYTDTFYQEIDGIRCINMGASMSVKERDRVADADKKEASGRLVKNEDRWEMYSPNTGHIILRGNAAGVDMIEAEAWLVTAGKYKEASPVKTEQKIRELAQEQLQRMAQESGGGQKKKTGTQMKGSWNETDIDIEDVELVYCPYFSIENGKKIRDILSPFRVVNAYVNGVRKQLFYDAYTGVLVQKF